MYQRGLHDRKGELFAYLEGGVLYTLEGEATGKLEGDFIVDMAGKQMWRVSEDGLYALDSAETIGYLGESSPDLD